MRIDSSGNVGIGTSSPTGRLTVSGTLHLVGSGTFPATGEGLEIVPAAAGGDNYVQAYSRTASSWQKLNITALQTVFGTNGSERMRIDASGNVLIGLTSAPFPASLFTRRTGGSSIISQQTDSASDVISIWNSGASGNNIFTVFYTEASITGRGSIDYNRAGNAVRYNTSSDYRLKENISDLDNALNKVISLKPRKFTWKETGHESDGFIAHELAEVVPDAVSGEKDAVDAEGNPQYQGIDTSFLVATLTAAIQELKVELDVLKSELNTLKGN
jgi:hypothetical protein